MLIYHVQLIGLETIGLGFDGRDKEQHQPRGVDIDLDEEIALCQTTYEAAMLQDGIRMPRAEVVASNHYTGRL